MDSKKYFVYLGCPGFPNGFAEVRKMTLISKSLVLQGDSVTVIANQGISSRKDNFQMLAKGNYQGVGYIYTSGSPFRPAGFFKRTLLKIKGFFGEYFLLRKLKKNNNLDYAILSTNSFISVCYYCLLSRKFRFKVILNYVEYYSAIGVGDSKSIPRLNNRLFDKFAPGLVDFVFPISEFLISQVKRVSPDKKYLKIPVLADLEYTVLSEPAKKQQYFLFCGALSYLEIIKFIIDSFCLVNDSSVFLYLVVNGSKESMDELQNHITPNARKDRIKLLSNLSEEQLIAHYGNAVGLLIPLRPTIQDEARFPHKIGEYLASGRPIVSTNYGEVKHYFTDMENMLIADNYAPESFAQKMQFIIENIEESEKIGRNGRQLALNNFDYKLYGKKITGFLDQAGLAHSHNYGQFEKIS